MNLEAITQTYVSARIMGLGYSAILRFNVNLNKPDIKNNTPKLSHSEYLYKDKNGYDCVSVKLDYSYYYILDFYNNGTKNSVYIGLSDMPELLLALDALYPILIDPNTFKTIDGKLEVNGKFDTFTSQFRDNKLIFEVATILGYEGNKLPGVRVYLGDTPIFSDVFLTQFIYFIIEMKRTSMPILAQMLVNYLPTTPLGTNRLNMNTLKLK